MNFLGNSFTWKLRIFLKYFIIFLYTFFFFLLQISFLTQIVLPEVKMGHFGENIPQGLQENPSLLMCKTCSHFSMAHSIIRKPLGSSPRRAWGFPTEWESASPGHPYSSERLSQLGRLPGHHAWVGGCGGQHLLSFFLTWINIIYSFLPSFLPPSPLPSFLFCTLIYFVLSNEPGSEIQNKSCWDKEWNALKNMAILFAYDVPPSP